MLSDPSFASPEASPLLLPPPGHPEHDPREGAGGGGGHGGRAQAAAQSPTPNQSEIEYLFIYLPYSVIYHVNYFVPPIDRLSSRQKLLSKRPKSPCLTLKVSLALGPVPSYEKK